MVAIAADLTEAGRVAEEEVGVAPCLRGGMRGETRKEAGEHCCMFCSRNLACRLRLR